MKIVQQTSPAGLPVSLAMAKLHLKIEDGVTDDDELIANLIKAVTSYVEQYTNRYLLTRTFTAFLDSVPTDGVIEIHRYPVTAISSVKYINTSDVLTTMSASDYTTDIQDCPARVSIISTPSVSSTAFNAIQVNFTAGHTDAMAQEKGVIQAMLVMIADLYEQRQSMVNNYMDIGSISRNILLDMYIKGAAL